MVTIVIRLTGMPNSYLNFESSCDAWALLSTVAVPPPAIPLATEATVTPIVPELETEKLGLEEAMLRNSAQFQIQNLKFRLLKRRFLTNFSPLIFWCVVSPPAKVKYCQMPHSINYYCQWYVSLLSKVNGMNSFTKSLLELKKLASNFIVHE